MVGREGTDTSCFHSVQMRKAAYMHSDTESQIEVMLSHLRMLSHMNIRSHTNMLSHILA